MKPYGKPFYANKLWGHGRTIQLTVRFYCKIVGHDWREKVSFYENYTTCRRGCGGITKV